MPERHRNHPHHHALSERAGAEAGSSEPYPFIYSKDPMDERRFLRPGESYRLANSRGPSSWLLWLLGILLALIIGAGLISAIIQSASP